MSEIEVPSTNLSSKSIDQSSNDPAHNGSINISNSNPSIIVDKSSEESKGLIDISNNPSHELEEQSLVERPLFAPFFTLIKTGETTAHPRQVHYLFSDDDTSEVLTSTILRSLFEENSSNTSLINSVDSKGKLVPAISSKSSRAITPTKLNRDSRTKNIEEEFADKGNDSKSEKRVIIVDLNSNGDGVASVNSLSSKWQVLNAQIEKAPTWNGTDDSKTGESSNIVGNLMLKIEGIASTDLSTHIALSTETDGTTLGVGVVGNPGEIKRVPGEEEMRNVLESFDLKMDILRRVIGTRSRLDSQDTVVESSS
ncbi:hypothetical protein EPUL_004182 [Erysiphe pulchra]|uniref:Uncharacterized protein n=1 Tax=Erysiphe pulchra TaxID=225359 RepID=A0A2S4PLU4_9PEZI|nr:hypothetical protein EPUL_004182 [Erysiphe pulchra]